MKEEDGIVEPLTFHLVLDPVPSQKDEQAVRLVSCDMGERPPAMWEGQAGDIAIEQTLLPCPASFLARRWQEGYAAATVHDGRIISHNALVPIVRSGPGAPSWLASPVPALLG